MEGRENGVKTGAKLFLCGDEVGEKNLFAITDETRLLARMRSSEIEERDRRNGGGGTSVEGAAVRIDGFDSSVVCSGLAFGGLAVGCSEEIVGELVDVCVTEAKYLEAGKVIHDLIEKVGLEVL